VGMIYNTENDHCDDPNVVDCGETIDNLPPHLVAPSCSNDASYRGQCTVACAPGYAAATTNFTCGLDGAWAGSLECVALVCTANKLVVSHPFTRGECTGDLTFGASCTLGCEDGYAPAGDVDVECTADQTFSDPGGECDPVCGDGVIVGGETCDDGKNHGVGCVFDCTSISDGFVCDDGEGKVCTTVCGDKSTAGKEECDDGNNRNGDGCSSRCEVEDDWECDQVGECNGKCGDGNVVGSEECDTTNGCTDQCKAADGFACDADANKCQPVLSCIGVKSGQETMLFPGGPHSQVVKTVCDQDYYIIDPARDDNWKDYLYEATAYGKDHNAIYGSVLPFFASACVYPRTWERYSRIVSTHHVVGLPPPQHSKCQHDASLGCVSRSSTFASRSSFHTFAALQAEQSEPYQQSIRLVAAVVQTQLISRPSQREVHLL
jgi:cysteine-rich repeat protein